MQRIMISMSALACLVATGCINTSGLEVSKREGEATHHVRKDDASFARLIEVEHVGISRTDLGFLRASVIMRSLQAKDLKILYKFKWFDDKGMEIHPGERPWEKKTVTGNEGETLAATAPSRTAVSFVVRVRRGEESEKPPVLIPEDIQRCAVSMVDSMLEDENLDEQVRKQFSGRRPVVTMDNEPIRNGTYMIGLRNDIMAKSIRARLVKSGKFDIGLQGGNVDYHLKGTLDRAKNDVGYYQLAMELENLRTGKIDWSNITEIKKEVRSPPFFGW